MKWVVVATASALRAAGFGDGSDDVQVAKAGACRASPVVGVIAMRVAQGVAGQGR